MKKYIYPVVVLALVGCTSLFPNYDLAGIFVHSSPDADARFATSMKYTSAHPMVSLTVPDEYCFYVVTDSHIDETARNLSAFITDYRKDSRAEFALHLGDVVNAQGNFPRFDSAIHILPEGYTKRVNDTIFITAGNHDIIFGQWKQFVDYYKTSTYTFETRSTTGAPLDFFLCYDSSSGTVGLKQLDWMRETLKQASKAGYRHIVCFTHTHFFKQDASQGHTSNYNIEETAELTGMFSQYGVSLVLTGHDHHREVTNYGGVKYIIVDAVEDHYPDPFYLVATMGKKIDYRFVAL